MSFRLTSLLRVLAAPIACAALVAFAPAAHADETAICYNCPPEWADWAEIGRAHV